MPPDAIAVIRIMLGTGRDMTKALLQERHRPPPSISHSRILHCVYRPRNYPLLCQEVCQKARPENTISLSISLLRFSSFPPSLSVVSALAGQIWLLSAFAEFIPYDGCVASAALGVWI